MRGREELRDVAGELGRLVSLIASLWSLYVLMAHAFFIPGSEWKERLVGSLAALGLAACVCVASGIFFCLTQREEARIGQTLPVRMLEWTVAATVVLFGVSWYLDVYYVPLLWKSLP
jgi:hypothetical protein